MQVPTLKEVTIRTLAASILVVGLGTLGAATYAAVTDKQEDLSAFSHRKDDSVTVTIEGELAHVVFHASPRASVPGFSAVAMEKADPKSSQSLVAGGGLGVTHALCKGVVIQIEGRQKEGKQVRAFTQETYALREGKPVPKGTEKLEGFVEWNRKKGLFFMDTDGRVWERTRPKHPDAQKDKQQKD